MAEQPVVYWQYSPWLFGYTEVEWRRVCFEFEVTRRIFQQTRKEGENDEESARKVG